MDKLILQLKTEHSELVRRFGAILHDGLDAPDAMKKIQEAKEILLNHLKTEDTELYPGLQEVAKSDPQVAARVDMFAYEMKEISKAAMAFFEKYEKGGTNEEFQKDLGKIIDVVKDRIEKEETELFPYWPKTPPQFT